MEKQLGYVPEMDGMIKTWDRNDHPELATGIRAIYKAKELGKCLECGEDTDKVIDYFGKLEFNCCVH